MTTLTDLQALKAQLLGNQSAAAKSWVTRATGENFEVNIAIANGADLSDLHALQQLMLSDQQAASSLWSAQHNAENAALAQIIAEAGGTPRSIAGQFGIFCSGVGDMNGINKWNTDWGNYTPAGPKTIHTWGQGVGGNFDDISTGNAQAIGQFGVIAGVPRLVIWIPGATTTHNCAAVAAGSDEKVVDQIVADLAPLNPFHPIFRPMHEYDQNWPLWGIGVNGNTPQTCGAAFRYLSTKLKAAIPNCNVRINGSAFWGDGVNGIGDGGTGNWQAMAVAVGADAFDGFDFDVYSDVPDKDVNRLISELAVIKAFAGSWNKDLGFPELGIRDPVKYQNALDPSLYVNTLGTYLRSLTNLVHFELFDVWDAETDSENWSGWTYLSAYRPLIANLTKSTWT